MLRNYTTIGQLFLSELCVIVETLKVDTYKLTKVIGIRDAY